MAEIHIPALDIRTGDVIIGESNGETLVVMPVRDGSLVPGFVTVETEHGPLILDNDRTVTFHVQRDDES